MIAQTLVLFVGLFTTLIAVINPLEALLVFLSLLEGKDGKTQRSVALQASLYATILMFFFLIFGGFVLQLFGIPLNMVRIVGGVILMRIGFDLFTPPASGSAAAASHRASGQTDVAFTPLAMPIIFGPGAMATVIGMAPLARSSSPQPLSHYVTAYAAAAAAIAVAMVVTFLCLRYANLIAGRISPKGISALTRIMGFFVAAIGTGLIFNGVVGALRSAGAIPIPH